MKKIVLTLATLFCFINIVAQSSYRVMEVLGTAKTNGKVISKGNKLSCNDIVSTNNKCVLKLTDGKNSYTVKFNNSKKVKELIENIPDVYEIAVNNIRKQIDSNTNSQQECSLVTMGCEEVPVELQENEAVALCKEDSVGNLTVTFMHHGMDKPIRYVMNADAYNYLLKMDIITAKGADFAYTSTSLFNSLWKPIEQYMSEGDVLMYIMPIFLSDIDMKLIPISEDKRMGDVFDMIDMGTE